MWSLPNASVAVTVVAGSPSATGVTATGTTAAAAARSVAGASSIAVLTGLCMLLAQLSDMVCSAAYLWCGWGGGPGGDRRHASQRGCSGCQLYRDPC